MNTLDIVNSILDDYITQWDEVAKQKVHLGVDSVEHRTAVWTIGILQEVKSTINNKVNNSFLANHASLKVICCAGDNEKVA